MSERKLHSGKTPGIATDRGGAWTIDVELGVLKDGVGIESRLEPRLSKLMFLLLSNTGKFVSRRELIDKMWPNTVVTDQSLTRAVADLRKSLNSNYQSPPIIETASKQGYRLMPSTDNDPSNKLERNPYWSILRMVAIGVGALVLLVLALRGISY